jgi:hypothetical protein
MSTFLIKTSDLVAADDGWSDSTYEICWGKIFQKAEEQYLSNPPEPNNKFDEYLDYVLTDVDEPTIKFGTDYSVELPTECVKLIDKNFDELKL